MIEWIVTSSALILLVIVLRVLIRDRVSPRLRYALWGLVLLRLMIPGTFWESRASVMAPVAAQAVYQEIQNIPSYVHTRPDGGVDVGHPSGGGWTTIPAEIASSNEPAFVDTKSGQTSTVSDKIRQVTVRNAFLLVWLAGSVLTGTFLLAVNLRFDRRLKKNRRTLEQYRGLWVFTMEGLSTPCLFGLFRPGIYLTPGLAEHEKIHVLAHEYTHFRQRDHLWAALRGACLALHWYNPLVWLAAYLSRRDCELSCDEGAVRLLGEENRADYGRTLVGLVARRTTPRDLACCATTMTGGKSALKERIALLVKHPRTTAAMAVLVAAACVVFAACTFTGAAKAETPEEPAQPVETETPVQPEEAPPEEPNLPSLEDLPRIFGISGEGLDEPMWWIGELQEEDIGLYWAQYEEQMYLRYGEHIQKIEDKLESNWLPELYFEDLDGDDDRELLVRYNTGHGTGVYTNYIAVYEWDGEQWYAIRHDPNGVIEHFNANRIYQFYQDGSAFISYEGKELLLDLSHLWESDYWGGAAPDICVLSQYQIIYTYEDGQLALTVAGELLHDGSPFLRGYAFEYVCPIYYYNGNLTTGSGELHSEFAMEPEVDTSLLTPIFRDILRGFIDQCRSEGTENLSGENFAICDVNGDGKNELITQRNNTYMAGQAERVYDADGNELLWDFTRNAYYDNGYVTAGWSHNQGVSGDKLWPYTLCRYDGSAGKYVPEASVDGWDKSIRDTYLSYDETTIPFPDDVDKDGDGFVYYIIEEDGGYAPVYGEPMDYADYALWVARYQGANRFVVTYYPLTEENIALIG